MWQTRPLLSQNFYSNERRWQQANTQSDIWCTTGADKCCGGNKTGKVMAIDWRMGGYLDRTTDTLSKEMTLKLNAEWQERAVMQKPEKSPPSRDHSMNKGHGWQKDQSWGVNCVLQKFTCWNPNTQCDSIWR